MYHRNHGKIQMVDDPMAREFKENSFCSRCRDGFTLIELLVVVSIISLLLAIMLPGLSRARVMAMGVVCRNNLKQIAFAWQMYLEDNEQRFYQEVNAQLFYGGWAGIYEPCTPRPLNRYLSLPSIPQSESGAKVFKCPGDDGSLTVSFYDLIGTSYQTNKLLIGQDQTGSLGDAGLTSAINLRLRGLKLTSVAGPARLVLIGDYTWGSQWVPGPPPGVAWHRKCCHYNVAFLDGHADFLRIRKGLLVTPEYCVLPFKKLYGLALEVQVEEPCEFCGSGSED
jgi:prepilin-type N-terminal cleavage/methylation domain-containing protein/prepilin-type processing-associated H-X9-DG protein